jgi:glucose/arabinose dehydrogenase
MMKLLVVLLLAVFLNATFLNAVHAEQPRQIPEIRLEKVLANLRLPVYATTPDDGTNRIFIVSLDGFIYIVKDGKHYPLPFLDLDGTVTALTAEQGMYGLAFHPDYQKNRRFFVSYIENGTDDFVVTEYKTYRYLPDFADPKSAREILRFSPKAPYHQGGQLAFGPDGYLYIAMGDGGEPLAEAVANFDVAQKLDTFAGKLLRIDVDTAEDSSTTLTSPASVLTLTQDKEIPKNYSIPKDNPFVNLPWVKTEIYALGFRNPWKFSFDRETGDLYLSDVGNYDWEEINLVQKGGNYGWPYKEGPVCFFFPLPTDKPKEERYADPTCEGSRRYNQPLLSYGHVAFDSKGGNAVTGGYVYRGKNPKMQGLYFFADWTNGRVWALSQNGYESVSKQEVVDTDFQISSFFEDLDGELYILTITGEMYHLVAR